MAAAATIPPPSPATIDWVQELQNYVRIDTSQPNVNYTAAINFLSNLVSQMNAGLYFRIHTHNTYPLMIVTKPGNTNRGILLNSHMDVVDAKNIADWEFPPFAGHYDAKTDRIYGRGTQDMKSQGIQYLAALYKLRNVKLDYTIHVSFVPNEEIGGMGGMADFVKTPQFRALNLEFAWDESCASPLQYFLVFFAERTIWQFAMRIRAEPGHAAMPLTSTCETKLKILLDEIARFRQRDLEIVGKRSDAKLGHFTTVNLTRIDGGELLNVLPREIIAYFDMRIGVDTKLIPIYDEINRWAIAANGGNKAPMTDKNSVTVEWIKRSPKSEDTDLRNDMCMKFFTFLQDNNVPYALTVAPGSTDARWLRDEGIPVLGFTPIKMTPPLLHGNNEYIYKKQFLTNIDLMTNLIKHMATN